MRALAAVAVCLCLLVLGDTAMAADSDAPRGAISSWLPNAEWVQARWLPYRQSDLERVLRITRPQLIVWLTDHRGLGDLARRRGLPVRKVIGVLMAPWRHRVPAAQLRLLTGHAELTFSQDHLAVHMITHTMHLRAINQLLPQLLGIGYREIATLRRQGLSWYAIGAQRGVSASVLRRRVAATLRSAARRGLAERQQLPAQEADMRHFQLSHLQAWLSYRSSVTGAAGASFRSAAQLILECHDLVAAVAPRATPRSMSGRPR